MDELHQVQRFLAKFSGGESRLVLELAGPVAILSKEMCDLLKLLPFDWLCDMMALTLGALVLQLNSDIWPLDGEKLQRGYNYGKVRA